VAPAPKLSDRDVIQLRRRIDAGEAQTALALEFGVDRKTIRRRVDLLCAAETAEAEHVALKRLRRRATREKQRLLKRDASYASAVSVERGEYAGAKPQMSDPFFEWLDTPKNLSGRARAEASGLVRIQSPDGTRRVWRDRSVVERLLDEGWRLDD
jgi:hypothetical protein